MNIVSFLCFIHQASGSVSITADGQRARSMPATALRNSRESSTRRNRIGAACYDFRMISLFGRGRPDHPMSDAASVRRILGELSRDPLKALEELGHWHRITSYNVCYTKLLRSCSN